MYRKKCHAETEALEVFNCGVVAAHSFSPPDILSDAAGHVLTTRGVALDEFIDSAPHGRDAVLAMRSAFAVLDAMHACGMLHLDAGVHNFILCRAGKSGSVSAVYSDGIRRHCYAVDYESLYTAAVPAWHVAKFDHDASTLSQYGRLPHAAYASLPTRYRFDVHALAESFRRLFGSSLPALNTACTAVVNHVPEQVTGLNRAYDEHTWTHYLLDTSHPVLTACEAVQCLDKLL